MGKKKFVANNFSVDASGLHAENSERFVQSAKPQATSGKLQAASNKRQAPSSKLQATSRKQQAPWFFFPRKVSSL